MAGHLGAHGPKSARRLPPLTAGVPGSPAPTRMNAGRDEFSPGNVRVLLGNSWDELCGHVSELHEMYKRAATSKASSGRPQKSPDGKHASSYFSWL